MYAIYLPCHVCGHDNSADALHCEECKAVINLQPTSTTQCLRPVRTGNTKEEELIQKAYSEVALLLQSVHRLQAMIDQKK